LRRGRWDDETVGGQRNISKQERSFLSMCATAFRNDLLSDNNPKGPPVLQKQIRSAGGKKNWIAKNLVRLRIFCNFLQQKKIRVIGSAYERLAMKQLTAFTWGYWGWGTHCLG